MAGSPSHALNAMFHVARGEPGVNGHIVRDGEPVPIIEGRCHAEYDDDMSQSRLEADLTDATGAATHLEMERYAIFHLPCGSNNLLSEAACRVTIVPSQDGSPTRSLHPFDRAGSGSVDANERSGHPTRKTPFLRSAIGGGHSPTICQQGRLRRPGEEQHDQTRPGEARANPHLSSQPSRANPHQGPRSALRADRASAALVHIDRSIRASSQSRSTLRPGAVCDGLNSTIAASASPSATNGPCATSAPAPRARSPWRRSRRRRAGSAGRKRGRRRPRSRAGRSHVPAHRLVDCRPTDDHRRCPAPLSTAPPASPATGRRPPRSRTRPSRGPCGRRGRGSSG